MLVLVLLSLAIMAISVGIAILAKKFIKNDKAIFIVLLISSLLTILCHYSSFIIKLFQGLDVLSYLKQCPNLILPMYPCNIVMILCFVFAVKKDKKDGFGRFLSDYLFYFGLFACILGMLVNVDYLNNPDLSNWEITKSIVAHGFMFVNVLLLWSFGYVKIDLFRNMLNMIISILMMAMIGLHVSLIFMVVDSYETAVSVNSMFLLAAPFGENLSFIKFPFISGCALVLYFGLFSLLELFAYKKGNRWPSRLKARFGKNKKEQVEEKDS